MLQHSINNILDFSRIDRVILPIHVSKFNLDTVYKQIKALFFYNFKEKGISFELEIDPKVPKVFFPFSFNNHYLFKCIISDIDRIKQILIILIGNSLKFTFTGKIILKVEVLDATAIKYTVIDTGIGFKEHLKKSLFNYFQSMDDSDYQHGIGLGLILCKHLINRLGPQQEIKIFSSEGKGSSISFGKIT